METIEPMRRPRVSAPWHTKRAPPSSSTIAMCSGERKPSGAACSVVNETTWPTPRTLVGVIGTGCHGHQVAGGATTASQRGQRDASIVSIMALRGASPPALQNRDPAHQCALSRIVTQLFVARPPIE